MNIEDLVEKVRRRLEDQGRKVSDTIDADIESVRDEALQALAHHAASHPDPRYRGYAQAEFTFAMGSGVADLSTEPTMMLEYVLRVTHANGGVMSNAVDVTYLSSPKNDLGRLWYAIEQDKLYGRLDDGETDPEDVFVTVLAVRVFPTLADVHPQLEDDLINIVGGMIESQPAAA